MKRILLAGLLLGLLATVVATVPVRLTVDLVEQRVCSIYGFGACNGDSALADVRISGTGLLFGEKISLGFEARTRGLERHYQAFLPHGTVIYRIPVVRTKVRILFPSPPSITASGSAFDVRIPVDTSGVGMTPRKTRILGGIKPVEVTLHARFAQIEPPTDDYCGDDMLVAPQNRVTFTVPGVALSLNADDIPGTVDSWVAERLQSDSRRLLSVPLANLVALGFELPSVAIGADGGADFGIELGLALPKTNIASVIGLLYPPARDRWSPLLALAIDLARDQGGARAIVAGNLARLSSTSPMWPIGDAAGRGWGCAVASGDRQGLAVMAR